ncbi:MAG: hypothetical protein QOG01_3595 [Pseudonocardiales bacterium]|nr:hypothetical protein [Pseudonocardiales bacterium]
MGKWISVIVSSVVGGALATVAAWGIVSSSTAAPSHNPAGAQVVDYGQK